MKVLVTGATGFIGSFLAEELCRRGHEVSCLVRKAGPRPWPNHPALTFIQGSLEDEASYAERLPEFHYIYHLAGLTKAASAGEFHQANVLCTRKLAARAAEGQGKLRRFLHVSSLAAAGPSLDGRPLSEDEPCSPVSDYGRSKLEGERAALEQQGLPVTVVRPPAVYGPRDRDFYLVFKAVRNRLFPDWGTSSYSLIYVADLVRGIIAATETGAAGRVYYLADRRICTNDDILSALSRVLGRKALRLRLPRSILPILGQVLKKIPKKGIINPDKIQEIRYPHWTCDPTRAMKEFGFHADTTLDEGFHITAEWYRKERWL